MQEPIDETSKIIYNNKSEKIKKTVHKNVKKEYNIERKT